MPTNELPLAVSYLTAAPGLVWLLPFIGTHYACKTSPTSSPNAVCCLTPAPRQFLPTIAASSQSACRLGRRSGLQPRSWRNALQPAPYRRLADTIHISQFRHRLASGVALSSNADRRPAHTVDTPSSLNFF